MDELANSRRDICCCSAPLLTRQTTARGWLPCLLGARCAAAANGLWLARQGAILELCVVAEGSGSNKWTVRFAVDPTSDAGTVLSESDGAVGCCCRWWSLDRKAADVVGYAGRGQRLRALL